MQESIIRRGIALSYGLSIIIQLFIYSYGGQLIMDKSLAVADNCYGLGRETVLIINRAQKFSMIEAKFFNVSLPTLRAVLSSAASLITLLKSFLD